MARQFNRRDFLKLTSLAASSLALLKLAPRALNARAQGDKTRPNIVIFVFDAMSARNLSIYGYPRATTPNLEKFAAQATVYHAHHAGGNFTTPGTASLLTGMYPWTHRAINEAGLVARALTGRNIFSLLGGQYQRTAYSQNMWPNYLFEQFVGGIDTVLPPSSFSAVEQIVGENFPKDRGDAYRAFDEFLFQDGTPPASLVFGLIARLFLRRQAIFAQTSEYDRGLPRTGNYPIYFKLDEVFNGMTGAVAKLAAPYFGYFHIWSPHAPYKPSKAFENLFDDNWKPVKKPMHRFGNKLAYTELNTRRRNYDEYIANVDDEFGKMIETLRSQGKLDNTTVIVTSDHGESFERGVDGHITPLLYEPLINVPLVIAAAGQKQRQDVTTPTSCIDILPTVLSMGGAPVPDWSEGRILPGLGGSYDPQRSIFSVEAATNPAFAPLKVASIAMRKDKYKLIYYTGHGPRDIFELYDMEADPEELTDLYPGKPPFAQALKDELLSKLAAANAPYQKK